MNAEAVPAATIADVRQALAEAKSAINFLGLHVIDSRVDLALADSYLRSEPLP